MNNQKNFLVLLLLTLFLAVACQNDENSLPTAVPLTDEIVTVEVVVIETAVSTISAQAIPTNIPPTATPAEPLAALVNGDPILLSTYEKALARHEQNRVVDDNNAYRADVLDGLIKQLLVVQAANAAGIVVTDEMVEEILTEYRDLAGEAGNFEAWLEANLYTEEEYRTALAADLAESQMVEIVTSDVPHVTEQVHARYIQVDDAALAATILAQIQTGTPLATLAQQHSLDRITGENGGDMGFFVRGSLLVPAVDDVAFSLQPGEVSDVIVANSVDGSRTMYYIVQNIERDPQRPLPADMRYKLLQQTFQTWLDQLWQQAEIERFVTTGS